MAIVNISYSLYIYPHTRNVMLLWYCHYCRIILFLDSTIPTFEDCAHVRGFTYVYYCHFFEKIITITKRRRCEIK